jgi:hypothetical protein
MPYCSASGNSGFLTLSGTLTDPILNSLTAQTTHRITTQFTGQSTPSILDKYNYKCIIEGGTTLNTLNYKNTKYTLEDIQICAPVHTGYNLPGNNSTMTAEMIISFRQSSTTVSGPVGLLLCFPMFNDNMVSNNTYLNNVWAIINGYGSNTRVSLYSLVKDQQKSLGYTTCFETQDSTTTTTNELYVVVFPDGIHLDNTTYTNITTYLSMTSSTPYYIPSIIRNHRNTVNKLTTLNGAKISEEVSFKGQIYTNPITICGATTFTSIFDYFIVAPKETDSSGGSSSSSTGLTRYNTSQYKCVPLDPSRILKNSNIYVSPDSTDDTLKTLLAQQGPTVKPVDNQLELQSAGTVMVVLGGAGAVSLIGCAAFCIYLAYKKSEP